jgi:hypothetical protein
MLHLIVESSIGFLIVSYLDYPWVLCIYFFLFIITMCLYFILLKKDPGINHCKEEESNILSLVEHKVNIKNHCPVCLVKNVNNKHCHFCNKCIEEFDHHCFWINNCIGKNNMTLFLLFITVILINVIFCVVISSYGKFNQN